MNTRRTIEGDWFDGVIPDNVAIDESAFLESTYCFHRFRSRLSTAAEFGRGASVYRQTVLDVGSSGYLSIGDFTMLNNMQIICDRRVEIGTHCLFSWNVVIMDSRRVPTDVSGRRRLIERAAEAGMQWPDSPVEAMPVLIGNNVWVGFDSVVLPGVTIGHDSVIGARSVVSADIPDRCIAVGNPARVIRTIQSPTS